MYGFQIENLIFSQEKTRHTFKGVFSANNLPSRLHNKDISYPSAYVANTDEDYENGKHWVSFFFKDKNSLPEYFDPYGLLPLKNSFVTFMGKPFLYSTLLIQNPISKTCGHYAIFFVIKRCEGYTFNDILSCFTSDTEWNDYIIREYIKELTINPSFFNTKSNQISLY